MSKIFRNVVQYCDKRYASLVYSLLLVIVVIQVYRTWGYFVDDGFIMLRYVQNILQGNGWVFNVGEYYNSSTSILQIVVHAIQGYIFGIEHLEQIAYLNFYVWLYISVLLIYKLLEKFNRYVATLSAITLLFIPHFYATFGIETTFNIGMTFLVLYFYQMRSFKAMYLVLSLLTLVRFDNAIFVSLMFLVLLFKDKISLKTMVKNGCFVIIPTLLWFIFSYFYFHKLFPESLDAKVWQGESGYWGTGLIYLRSMTGYIIFFVLPWLRALNISIADWQMSMPTLLEFLKNQALYTLLLLISFILCARGFVIGLMNFRHLSAFMIFVCWSLIHTGLYGLWLNVPGYHWYFSHIIIVLIISLYLGSVFTFKYRFISYLISVPIVIAFFVIFIRPSSTTMEDGRTIPYRNLAAWINENTPLDSTIIHDEVGELAFLTQRKTIDGFGLTSPQHLSSLKRGLRDIFWILNMNKLNDVYYVSYHNLLPSPFVKDLFESMLVYEGNDALKIRLYKIDKSKFILPLATQLSLFNAEYELSGPKDRIGTRIIELNKEKRVCPAFGLHAQNSSEESVQFRVSDFGDRSEFSKLSFSTVFPTEAIEKGTDGSFIDVSVWYTDGTNELHELIHRIKSQDILINSKEFSIELNKAKHLDEIRFRPHDEHNAFDWLHICNPVLS